MVRTIYLCSSDKIFQSALYELNVRKKTHREVHHSGDIMVVKKGWTITDDTSVSNLSKLFFNLSLFKRTEACNYFIVLQPSWSSV